MYFDGFLLPMGSHHNTAIIRVVEWGGRRKRVLYYQTAPILKKKRKKVKVMVQNASGTHGTDTPRGYERNKREGPFLNRFA